jgi:hypothetical protein
MTFKVKDGISIAGSGFVDGSRNVTAGTISGSTATLTGELRGPATFVIDPAAVGDNTGVVVIKGDLQVDGVTTTVNSTTLTVDDKNIELGSVASPTDSTASGGGITLKGATDKTFQWSSSSFAWESSEHIRLAAGKDFILAGATSGTIALEAVATAGTNTIAFPAATGTVALTSDIKDPTITVTSGAGLTGSGSFTLNQSSTATITLSHADTSSAATLTASGRTYVTGLTFDTYGHVTGYTTGTETVTDTNTVTRLRGTASGTYTSGDLTLLAGSGIGVSQSGADFTISSTETLQSVTTRGNTTTTNINTSSTTVVNLVPAGNLGVTLGGIQDATSGWSLSGATIGLKSDNTTYATMGLGTGNGLLYFGRTNASGAGTLNSWLEVNNTGVANFKLARPQHNGSNLALVSEINNATLTLNVSGNGLSGSQTFTANQASAATFTVTSNATNANTGSTLVFRDASGNFSAGTITAALSGNASTATNISNTGSVTLASSTESNDIFASQPSYTTSKPVKLLNFNWYGNTWSLGNIRSGNTASEGLGVFYGSSNTEVGRFTTSGLTLQSGYSFSGAGTGLTGTATSLSIGGNAATATTASNATTAGGLAVHAGTNNEANKIVRTDANGYIQAGWINSISGDNGTTTPTRIYASQDGYIRYYSVANFRQVIDVPTRTGGNASGTWGINITGSAGSATTATTANNVNAPDGDRNAGTKLPNTNARNVRFDFVGASSAGTGGNYAGLMTYAPWDGTTASTGDASYQLAFGSTAANGGGIPQLNIRKGIDSTWNSWYTLIHTGNISTYSSSPTLQTLTIDSNGNLDYNKYDSSSTATINIKNVPLNFTGSGTLSFSSNDLILTL